jgi:hypothetical protein
MTTGVAKSDTVAVDCARIQLVTILQIYQLLVGVQRDRVGLEGTTANAARRTIRTPVYVVLIVIVTLTEDVLGDMRWKILSGA